MQLDKAIVNHKLLKKFDPEDDKWDRRALFEVTGIRLYDGDFLDSDTSDEETQIKNRQAYEQFRIDWLKGKIESNKKFKDEKVNDDTKEGDLSDKLI